MKVFGIEALTVAATCAGCGRAMGIGAVAMRATDGHRYHERCVERTAAKMVVEEASDTALLEAVDDLLEVNDSPALDIVRELAHRYRDRMGDDE